MKLQQKGRSAPPPKLPRFAQQLSQELAHEPGVTARAHWRLGDEAVVDGADFYLGQEELGHLHLDAEAHVAQVGAVRNALLEAGLASEFRWSPEFVTAPVEKLADVGHAKWLFNLRRRQLEGVPVADLIEEILAKG